jgi:hypothetical protein
MRILNFATFRNSDFFGRQAYYSGTGLLPETHGADAGDGRSTYAPVARVQQRLCLIHFAPGSPRVFDIT